MNFDQGDYVLIESPGHRVDGKPGVVLNGPGELLGSYTVLVGNETYGLMPHELSKLTIWHIPGHPESKETSYNVLYQTTSPSGAPLTLCFSVDATSGRHALDQFWEWRGNGHQVTHILSVDPAVTVANHEAETAAPFDHNHEAAKMEASLQLGLMAEEEGFLPPMTDEQRGHLAGWLIGEGWTKP